MRGLVVSVPIADADVAADILWQLGVRAIEERPSTEGTVELWTTVGDAADATTRARRALGERWAVRVVELETTAADTWRDFAGPMWVDDALVIVPAWIPVSPVPETRPRPPSPSRSNPAVPSGSGIIRRRCCRYERPDDTCTTPVRSSTSAAGPA
jgi:hypothetical protein